MVIKDISKKYGWTEQKEAVRMHRTMILRDGLQQSKNTRENKPDMNLTVCCLEQRLTRQSDGLEMSWDMPMRRHGQNRK